MTRRLRIDEIIARTLSIERELLVHVAIALVTLDKFVRRRDCGMVQVIVKSYLFARDVPGRVGNNAQTDRLAALVERSYRRRHESLLTI